MHFPLTGRRVTSLSPRVHKDTGKTRISLSKLARKVVTRLVMDQGKAQAEQNAQADTVQPIPGFLKQGKKKKKKKKKELSQLKSEAFPKGKMSRCLW
jgi:hypothetical protein